MNGQIHKTLNIGRLALCKKYVATSILQKGMSGTLYLSNPCILPSLKITTMQALKWCDESFFPFLPDKNHTFISDNRVVKERMRKVFEKAYPKLAEPEKRAEREKRARQLI